jgi:hypothetical protein
MSTNKKTKIVLFSKSGKWHDSKNTSIICKIGAKMCGFPDLKL